MRVGGGLSEVLSLEAVEGVIPSALAAVVEVGAIGAFLWMGIGGMLGWLLWVCSWRELMLAFALSSRKVRCVLEWVSMTV